MSKARGAAISSPSRGGGRGGQLVFGAGGFAVDEVLFLGQDGGALLADDVAERDEAELARAAGLSGVTGEDR